MPSFAISFDPDYEVYKKLWCETWLYESFFLHIRLAQTHASVKTHILYFSSCIRALEIAYWYFEVIL